VRIYLYQDTPSAPTANHLHVQAISSEYTWYRPFGAKSPSHGSISPTGAHTTPMCVYISTKTLPPPPPLIVCVCRRYRASTPGISHLGRNPPPPAWYLQLFVPCIPTSATQVTTHIAHPTLSPHPLVVFVHPQAMSVRYCVFAFTGQMCCPAHLLCSCLLHFRYIIYSSNTHTPSTPCTVLRPRNMVIYFAINTVILKLPN